MANPRNQLTGKQRIAGPSGPRASAWHDLAILLKVKMFKVQNALILQLDIHQSKRIRLEIPHDNIRNDKVLSLEGQL